MRAVFRAPMRSRDPKISARPGMEGAAVERALQIGVCGMGGRLDEAPGSLDAAFTAAAVQHEERLARRLQRFAQAPDGAEVWTRDVDGLYWRGVLNGPWRYDASSAAAAVDLVHVRACAWSAAPCDAQNVPPAVRASFARGGRNWQRIHAATPTA